MASEIRIVTVAIPTYNRAGLSAAGAGRRHPAGFPADRYEVIVIDNNSRDDTRAAVAAFATARPAPRHVLETRQGLVTPAIAPSLRPGAKSSSLPTTTSSWTPDWIRELTAPFLTDTRPAGSAPSAEKSCPCSRTACRRGSPNGMHRSRFGRRRTDVAAADADRSQSRHSPVGLRGARLVHTSLGRQGKALFSGGEGEMIRRLRSAGLEIWFAPAAQVLHQMPASRMTFRYASRHAFDSARSRVVDRVTARRRPAVPGT